MADIRLKAEEIDRLLCLEKIVPAGLYSFHKGWTIRAGCSQKSLELACSGGEEFVIKLREAVSFPQNYSVILGYKLPGVFTVFRLGRYNGKHKHTNHLENESFIETHRHTATERYQRKGYREDHFAEISTAHYNLKSAVDCLVNDCGFVSPFHDSPLFRTNR
jgi:hypothetical protein